jgi:acyl transferase domain-containing protein
VNTREILSALQAKEISPKDAEKKLKRIVPEQFMMSDLPEQSKKQNHLGQSTDSKEAIAIIGMAGRYPGASELDQYWDNLVQAKNLIQEIPKSRWDVNQYYDPRLSQKGKVYCKSIGLLDEIENFDPTFFSISATEAAAMDPQHRIFLQEGYKAFEDAGYSRQVLSNKKCGVYLGIMNNEYSMMLYKNQTGVMKTTGVSSAIAAARIAYYLNLKGPAISIDTACSSSLVAAHLACQSLLNQEIDMALVGGVSLYLTPESYIGMCEAGMLSPDGQCKTFDSSANGFVPGEGVGALVLKRLKDAEADNDTIYGVIIGSGINQNGNTNGITAPSKSSQIELVREIYNKYKIHPESISYVEAHGTGTKLGDLIELEALSTVFKEQTNQKTYCAIGSVKSNIGHTSAAVGIAGIEKILLSMKFRKLVPTLNFRKPNEHFNFEESPFYVNTELKSWESSIGIPRRASVSSFGFSGSNAHIVIEEYLPKTVAVPPAKLDSINNPVLFVLSAKSEEQLDIYAEHMRSFIERHEAINLVDMAYTLQVGREAMEYRLAFLANSREAMLKALEEFIDKKLETDVLTTLLKNREGVLKADEDKKALWIQERELGRLGELWVKNSDIDWGQLYVDTKPCRISLPTYPFAKERYWIDETGPETNSVIKQEARDSLSLRDKYNIVPEMYVYDEPYLKDHTVYDEQVLIGMTHGSLAINTFFKIFPQETGGHLHRLDFIKPIEIKKDQQVEVLVEPVQKGDTIDVQVMYRHGSGTWNLTATGNLQKVPFENENIDIESIKSTLEEIHDFNQIYTSNQAIGLGESFKTITHLYMGKDQVLARIALSETSREEAHDYFLHPLVITSGFLAVTSLLGETEIRREFLPFGIKDICFQKIKGLNDCWMLVRLVKNSGEMVTFDVDVINDESQVVARLLGCSIKRLRSTSQLHAIDSRSVMQKATLEITDVNPLEVLADTSDLLAKIQKYLTSKLSQIVSDHSRVSDVHTNLMDLGLASSQLVALTDEIKREINAELNPTLFFEYPNIKELSEYFSQEYQNSFIQLLGMKEESIMCIDRCQEVGNKKSEDVLKVQSSKLETSPEPVLSSDSMAIIGMSGRLAEAATLDEFWDNLCKKKDVIKEIPLDHWDYRPWYDKKMEVKNTTYCKWGSFIDDVDKFDASFFNISPREADWMDPQLRLLMESIYATGEDAGYINQLRGSKTGVFVGVCCHDYADLIAERNLPIDPYSGTGNAHTVIANRISFAFDLIGPSIAVDTACSSSLFALHSACQALRNKECEMAFVGGVNLLLSSAHYRYFSSIGALSPTGRCHTFDEAADGYVPGECIASILLKPLEQAMRDGDHIYAIIKGSAALHGGYTPSLTAPSVSGEENVILKAWDNAGINPETLSYLEAHGTGTKLGDPIEVSALKKAFGKFTQKENFCAIGSLKASIGHTEGAAGIAGLLKVVLQMKHRQIPAMPQFENLNPYIQLDKSALYINQELEEWKNPEGVPRRAGISAFGFAGAYAHVVIEEYIPENQEQCHSIIAGSKPAIIVLSAKNEERMKKQAQQLLLEIQTQSFSDENLTNIAYTLQVGRESMEERLGLIVRSMNELEEKLKSFVEGQKDIEGLYRGQVKRNKEMLAVFAADEDMAKTIEAWIDKGKYSKLIELWVKGLVLDWNKLYGDDKPRRISLSTYPFVKERYWIPQVNTQSGDGTMETNLLKAKIHPLLHQNTSTFSEQCFSSSFTGKEFFLSDHIVKGHRILPGMGHLEMARVAVERAIGDFRENKAKIRLKNVIWMRPIAMKDEDAGDQVLEVHVRLCPEDDGKGIFYEIYSNLNESSSEPVIYSQGTAEIYFEEDAPTLNIDNLLVGCDKSKYSSNEWYQGVIGDVYGPGFRGVEMVYIGSTHVVAKLTLPSCVLDTWEQYDLHPSIMDSAVQVPLILDMDLLAGGIESFKPSLPFALQEVNVVGKCTSTMWALARYSEGSRPGDKVLKFDIDLCDDKGNICVQMKGLSSRVLEGEVGSVGFKENIGTIMFHPYWKEQVMAQVSPVPDYDEHLVMLCEMDGLSRKLQMNGVRCITLQAEKQGIEERFKAYAVRVLEEIQYILQNKSKKKVLIQLVVWTQGDQQLFAGLSGLLKTAQLENSKLMWQLIEVESGEDEEEIIAKLMNSRSSTDNNILYQDDKRYVNSWREVEAPKDVVKIPWKDHGVYLITGGVGGLGLIFAKEIVEKVKEVTLILTGRSLLTEDMQTKLKDMQKREVNIVYKQVDVTDKQAVESLIQNIQEKFGSINGIIHSAGVIRDNFILKKTKEEFEEVLAPKVTGLVNLDQASRDINLDFFLFFSSIAASLGNAGQSDYSTANAFMDIYARYRNNLVASKHRHGQTLSINWPLWKEGGMQVDEKNADMIMQNIGMIAMPTLNGIQTLYQSLVSGNDQVMVFEGNVEKFKKKILPVIDSGTTQSKSVSETSVVTKESDISTVLVSVKQILLQNVAKILGTKIEDINTNIDLNEYGFDSITLTEFTNTLSRTYKIELVPTILFEYPTLNSFAGYLVERYKDVFTIQSTIQAKDKKHAYAMKNKKDSSNSRQFSSFINRMMLPVEKNSAELHESIAIVGISGRFPMAEDVKEFWENIAAGKDCIMEIPKARWDWREYYGDTIEEANKTSIKWGGFIDGVDEFDPLFFGISPKEAELMDPQQRLLMTYVWKAIEDAGITQAELSQKLTGVFIAAGPSEYNLFISHNSPRDMTAIVPSMTPNRISHTLNLRGPSEYYETACSSTMVALHRAVQSIRSHECEQAIVGAVNLLLSPEGFIGFESMGYLSSEGKAKSFQAEANGYVRSEGVGAIIIKPLTKAIEDQDLIYAVIKGTGVSHGGKGMSLTAPSATGMKAAMIQAYEASEIDSGTVSYIEAHGIASPLGDAIEISALKSGYQERTTSYLQDLQAAPPCYISSLKPYIGHGEMASGMAALIKVIMAMRHRLIPGIPGFTKLHENISFKDSPFKISAGNQRWEALTDKNGNVLPRRASINSYGFSGVNAHVVLEEYLPFQEKINDICPEISPQIVVFSAKNQERLRVVSQQMLEFIELQDKLFLPNLAYTLQVGRLAMESRLAMVVNNQVELIEGIKEYLNSSQADTRIANSIPIFTGELEEDNLRIANLFSEEVEKVVNQALLRENNLGKIAQYWAKGGNVSWEALHEGQGVRRMALPTYPFAKERYWFSTDGEQRSAFIRSSMEKTQKLTINSENSTKENIREYITQFLSHELNIATDKIKFNKNIQDYGVDSIIIMKLIRHIEKYFQATFTGRDVFEFKTIEALSVHLALKIENMNYQKVAVSTELKITSQQIGPCEEGLGDTALEQFKQGNLTMEEIENLIDKGMVI